MHMKNIEHIALGVHMVAFLFAISNIAVADWKGLTWLRGRVATLPAKTMRHLHNHVWFGLILLVLSGGVLFSFHIDELLVSTAFFVKLGCLVVAIINGLYIRRHMSVSFEMPFASLAPRQQMALKVSGIISTIAWLGIVGVASFILPE